MKHRILGDAMQTVAIELSQGESVFSPLGTMLFVRGGITSETSPLGNYWTSIRSVLNVENEPPMVIYRCDSGTALVSFKVPSPGRIQTVRLDGSQRVVIRRKSLLASTEGVQFDPLILDGERTGVITPKLFVTIAGSGTVYLHGRGNLVDINLSEGEKIAVDGMQLLTYDDSVDTSPKPMGNPGGSGESQYMLIMHLTGPGRVLLQTLSTDN